MSKSLLKIISLSLIFILVTPMFYDAFNARIVFADEGVKGDLPFESVNRDHYFRMVEMCWPKYLQKLIRKLANWAIDKIGENILRAIPHVGNWFGEMWDKFKVFREKVDLPIFPRCNCKDDDNTQDSAYLPLNWMFSQHYIKDQIKDERMTKKFPTMEGNQHPMFLSADIKPKSYYKRSTAQGYMAFQVNTFYNVRNYDVFLLHGTGNYDRTYPIYNGFTPIIDEQQRLADKWRRTHLGYMLYISRIQKAEFDDRTLSWRAEALEDIFTTVSRDIPFDKKTVKEKDNKLWDPLEWFKEIEKIETTEDKKNMSLGQTVALQRVGAPVHLLAEQIESNAFTSYTVNEVAGLALQTKKSTRQAFHKNVDLMGHHAASKKSAGKKTKLGFN